MAGLVPAIHVCASGKGVDARARWAIDRTKNQDRTRNAIDHRQMIHQLSRARRIRVDGYPHINHPLTIRA
jgi:hypothetical protein